MSGAPCEDGGSLGAVELLAEAAVTPLAAQLIDRLDGRQPRTIGSLATALLLLARAGVNHLLDF